MGVKCGSNCLRHALKNSAPSSCRFEFANSFINMNISSGSLGAPALFTNFRYSSSTLFRFAERVSLLRRTRTDAAITSRRTHSPAPIHKRERTFINLSYPLPGHQERTPVAGPHRAQPFFSNRFELERATPALGWPRTPPWPRQANSLDHFLLHGWH